MTRIGKLHVADKEHSRRDYITLAAFDPSNPSEPCEVLISFNRMQAVGRRSLGHAKECAYSVPAILQGPSAVFEGLRHDDDEDARGFGWRCYCGIPRHSYAPDGGERRPYPNQVYLVFVNDERVAYNWRWEKADPDNPQLPTGFAMRFKARLH